MKDTLIVNLLGGSGCGKSTNACRLFSMLKDKGIDCELVTEYVKDMVWEGRNKVFTCQPYIFGKQLYKIVRVHGQVDVIITDRPIFLDIVYGENEGDNFREYVLQKFNSFNNLNILLNRVKPFSPNGRNESNIAEAKAWDTKVRYWLDETQTPYVEIDGNKDGCNEIFEAIISRLVISKLYKEGDVINGEKKEFR